MSQKKIIKLVSCLLLLLPLSLNAERHSRKKRIDRVESRKKIVITDDQKLARALSKHSKNLTFDEAVLAKPYYMKEHDTDMAIKCAQRLVAVANAEETMRHQDMIRQTRFELIELLLEKKKYADVEKYAMEYQKFYPGTSDTLKAEYITILANFMAQLPSMKDQEKTRTTIKLAEEFLDKHPQASNYTADIKRMLSKSYKTLIRSEMHIIQTHLNAFNWTKNNALLEAAQKRLDYINERYLPHAMDAKKRLIELEIQLALAANKDTKTLESMKNSLPITKTAPKQSDGMYDYISNVFTEDNEAFFDQP